MLYDIIIIGAGPAGMSAAVYTARKGLSSLILSKNIGGQTALSWEVDNYLGYYVISGQELADKFKEHLTKFDNLKFRIGEEVEELTTTPEGFKIKTPISEYLTKSILIASGKEPRKLNVPGEDLFLGRGITYCAICDGPLFKGKTIAVIGGGNAALETAVELSKNTAKVYLINNKDQFSTTADAVFLEQIKNNPQIEILYNTETKEFVGDKSLTHIKAITNGEEKLLEVKGAFIEIGSLPSVDFLKKQQSLIKLNQWNEIEIDKKNMTNIPGIFAAGDVTDVLEKQVVIAAGEGAKAAIQVGEWLSKQK